MTTTFFQAAGAVLVAILLIMTLKSQGKEMGMLLSIFLCAGLGCLAIGYLQPVIVFLQHLQELGQLDGSMMTTLLKVVGISFLTEIVSLVCTDAGNGALAKGLQLLSVAVILYLSLPMLQQLFALVESVLEYL